MSIAAHKSCLDDFIYLDLAYDTFYYPVASFKKYMSNSTLSNQNALTVVGEPNRLATLRALLIKEQQEEEQSRPSSGRTLLSWFRAIRNKKEAQPVVAAQRSAAAQAVGEVPPTAETPPIAEIQPAEEVLPTTERSPAGDDNETIKLALGAVFETVESAELKLQQVAGILKSVGQLDGAAITTSLESIRAFEKKVHGACVPVLAYEDHLAKAAEHFEPMKLIHGQLRELQSALSIKVAELAKAMGPVKEFSAQLRDLSRAFEPADELYDQLAQLQEKLGESLSPARA